jgi:hypothetical protein
MIVKVQQRPKEKCLEMSARADDSETRVNELLNGLLDL